MRFRMNGRAGLPHLGARRRLFAAITLAVTTGLVGCSPSAAPEPRPSPSGPSATELPTLRTLIEAENADCQLTVGDPIAADGYASNAATYSSDGLTISAVLHQPSTPGPHPGIVVVHGFVDATTYTSGSELAREQDALARAGYVVLYTDLRGLAGSDPAPTTTPDVELGATTDVINAAQALATSGLSSLDADRIGVLGHSLGGLAVLGTLVVRPDLIDAGVAFAPASTDLFESLEQFLAPGDPRYDSILKAYGTPEENPDVWADLSALTFVDRAEAPLLIVHGTADATAPVEWSEQTAAEWEAAGKEVRLIELEGEGHVFDARWQEAMDATLEFFAEHLRSG